MSIRSGDEIIALVERITKRILNEKYPPIYRERIVDEILNDPTTKYDVNSSDDREFISDMIDEAVGRGLIKEILIEVNGLQAMYVKPDEKTFSLAITCGDSIRMEAIIDAMTGNNKGTPLRLGPQL